MALTRLASPLLKVHPSVVSALANKRPVVALESTIITHGLPFPANIETAQAIEQAVRDQGAVPATTAFIDGVAHVGLESSQLQRLAEVGLKATKTSRRDVASVLAGGRGSIGATTVSGTMILAHMAGISIFGTGGIGGVHRGGETSLDVSADLTELSRTPVAVFCSGAKSILDIPRTLEYLETLGVSTHTFHPSGQFPAFYSANSGCKVPVTSSYRDAARLIHSNLLFNLQSGMIFGVPIPSEFEEAGNKLQAVVEQAVQEAKEAGIDRQGKEVTPWLLKRVGELSQGQSITNNKALVINNVSTAAKVACELEILRATESQRQTEEGARLYFASGLDSIKDRADKAAQTGDELPKLNIVGFTAVDITSRPDAVHMDDSQFRIATTWPGCNTLSLGGVARNMSESAHRMLTGIESTASVQLISPIGDDVLGQLVRVGLSELGMLTDGLLPSKGSTASVTLQLDASGDLVTGIADIDEDQLQPDQIDQVNSIASDHAKVVAFDGNISTITMQSILSNSNNMTLFEPTSVTKCIKIVDVASSPDVMTPNEAELIAMHRHSIQKGLIVDTEATLKEETIAARFGTSVEVVTAARDLCNLKSAVLLIKGGERGVLMARPQLDGKGETSMSLQGFPPHKIEKSAIVNTTGCGDTFAGAVAACIHAKVHRDLSEEKTRPRQWSDDTWSSIIDIAQQAALLTLQSTEATSTNLNILSKQVSSMANR